MIEPKQREGKTLLGSSRAKAIRLIRTATAILLFGASFTAVYGQAPDLVKTADKKTPLSPQQQSLQRDQAYVRQLLQRGTSDAKPHCLRSNRACSAIKPMCANFCREGLRTRRPKVFSNYRADSRASTPRATSMRTPSASLPKRRQL